MTDAQDPGTVRVILRVLDPAGEPTGVRLRITDRDGAYVAPLGHLSTPVEDGRSAGDVILGDGAAAPFEVHALVFDGAAIDLLPGRYSIQARRGFEFEIVRVVVEITEDAGQAITIRLRRFDDPPARGWISGDSHVHFPDPLGLRYEMGCEDLSVCSLLIMKIGFADPPRPGDGYFVNSEHFTGGLSPASDADHVIKVGEEFRHGLLGHLVLQDLSEVVWPVSTGGLPEAGAGGLDWPLLWGASGEAHRQDAIVSWAHWPYPSMEAPLDIALGAIDSIDLLTVGDPFELHPELVDIYRMVGPAVYSLAPIEVYYHYLHCGFRLGVTAGSDKMGLYPPLGSARTYVQTNGVRTYDAWTEGIRQGRTFVSTYPLLELSVDDCGPGDIRAIDGASGVVSIVATACSLEPYNVLEVVHDGRVIAAAAPTGPRHEARIDVDVKVGRDGWIASRAHGRTMLEYGRTWRRLPVFAHTSPVYLDAGGRRADASSSATLFLEQLGTLARWIVDEARLPGPGERAAALDLIRRAEAVYERLIPRQPG